MSLSVNSAASALAALQALSAQEAAGGTTSSATPSAPIQASAPPAAADATVQPSAAQSLYATVNGVGQALTASDAADAAGQSVLGLLQQMRDAAGQARAPDLGADARAQLRAGFQAAAGRIGDAVAGAGVGGLNLIDGSISSGLKVALGDGATSSLTPADLTLGGSTLGSPAGVDTATQAASSFATLGAAIGATSTALSTLRGQADQIDVHAGFVQQLGQALAGPQDDGADSVRLLALQVSQQLAGQTGAMANASPQSVLSLFRS